MLGTMVPNDLKSPILSIDGVGGAQMSNNEEEAGMIPIELRASNWPLASQSSILASLYKRYQQWKFLLSSTI